MDEEGAAAVLAGLALLLVGLAGCLEKPGTPTGPPDASGGGPTSGADGRDRPYDPGWPPIDEASIRPGAKLGDYGLRGWNACTAGFVLADPSNTTLYVASAAHCFGDVEIGAEIPLAGIEDAGTLAYCSWGTIAHGSRSACPASEALVLNRSRDNDFALVRVADEHRGEVHPAMFGFEGPAGLDREASVGEKVLTYGNTPLRDDGRSDVPDVLDPREGYVEGQGEWTTRFHLVGHTLGGDSGSPVRTPEGALGLLIRTGGPESPAAVHATNLGPAIDYANENTDLTVELKTWPDQEPGSLPRTP